MNERSLIARLLPRPLWPLSRRLPVLVLSIVLVLMATVLLLVFQRMYRLSTEVASAHLQASSGQLVSTMQIGGIRLRREGARLASLPAVAKAASPFATTSDVRAAITAARAELERAPQTVSIAVWSDDGKLVLSVGDTAAAAAVRPLTGPERVPSDTASAVILPLVVRGDSIYIAVAGRVRGTAGPGGFVVATRLMQGNAQALELLRGLVGPEARIHLGNASGDVWTDLSRRVDGIGAMPDSGAGQHVSADGTAYLHAIASIPGTPWRIMVDVPRRWATATAGGFVLEIAGLVIILVAGAAFIIWLSIQRSLRPLHAVTDAVSALARGEPRQPVEVTIDDELGRLGASFNQMASQVEAAAQEVSARAEALATSNRELQQSEERYRALVDHLPDGIIVHWDQRITFANRAAARLFEAADPAELHGRSMLEFIDAKELEAVTRRLREVQVNGTPAPPRDVKLRRSGNRPVIVEARSTRLATGGRSGVQTILHDVTERRLLEEQLRQSQKMEAVGRLAGGVAHDFNNILTVIDAHAEFAKNPAETAEARLEDIVEIQKASASAAQLTRQLLAFSRRQSILPVRVDLNATVSGLRTMLRRLIGESIEIALDLDESLWTVQADAGQMDQVLMNLSVNARDAMPHGGRLSFRTKNMAIGPDYQLATGERVPKGDYVLLAVEDTGTGMSQDIQSKIFEPFFTTKQLGQGTGLGLSTVYGIVKQSGGFIWVYSEPGSGTAFKILFPRCIGDDEAPSLTRTSEYRIRAREAHLLLVEDHESVRVAISRALRVAGFVVHEAGDADEAERILSDEQIPIDVVVTDMMMPGRTGAELANGTVISARSLPVVIMSGYSEEFTNREWCLPPNVTFLEKPVSPSSLIRLLSELLG